MRILSVIDIPWNSGLASYAFDQALALRGAGHEVFFACPAGSAAAAFAAREGFRSYVIPGRKSRLGLPLAALKLRAAAKACSADVVCAHTGSTQTLSCLLGLPLIRVKADARKPSAGFTFSAVDGVIAASGYIAGLYAEAGLPSAKVATIRQGIALPDVPPPAAGKPLKIGMLGRLDPVKGHEVFLRAAAILLASGAKAEFHVAGYEANIKYADLLRLAEELEIADSVVFHGRVDGPFNFIGSCDVGVIASLGSEAVSRAALEWLAAGRPLVSTTAGSLPEYAGPGWLVPPGDPAALAAKIGELLSAPEKIAAEGERNRARAAADFSPAAFASATLKIFEDAAAGSARRAGWAEV
ncbi:MAG: glycosyltransferase family 4 protein [Elusimicrobia bacterium]|nr:glycosyltransferase family 4 protein [Elusimicrobiota bacterium]